MTHYTSIIRPRFIWGASGRRQKLAFVEAMNLLLRLYVRQAGLAIIQEY